MTVSIVVTCYNYGRYLKTCLDSVLAQTFIDFEVIVVDDGSTDDTATIMRPYLDDPRVRYHYQENQGQTAAKNVGIRMTRGALVAFLDADDYWLPTKLARQVPLSDNPHVGVSYTGYFFVDEHNQRIPADAPSGYLSFHRGRVSRQLAFDNFVPFSGSLIRRTLLDAHGGFDETMRMGIDWDIWLRLSVVTEFDFVPDELVAYRVGHANQMSKNKEGRLAAADRIFRQFVERNPGVLSSEDLEAIEFYNACSRAAAYRQSDLGRSTTHLIKAWRMKPLSGAPYKGFVRNAQSMIARRVRGRA